MKIQKQQSGFTLIELVTVVTLVSILVVYLTLELGQANDDAKVSMSTAFLLGNVPHAISAYQGRHIDGCETLDTEDLTDRGLNENTPWVEAWSVTAATKRTVTVNYPTTGSTDEAKASEDIFDSIDGKPQIVSATDGTGSVSVVYKCI